MSNIKDCFVSRYKDGYLVQADFSQLEVHGLAFLSGDPTLIANLNAGVDLHRDLAARFYRVRPADVTSEQRTLIKRLTFMLQYGSGHKNMAAKLGISEREAKNFIDVYHRTYPGVAAWQTVVADAVHMSKTKAGVVNGRVGYKGTYLTRTGRTYTFHEVEPSNPRYGWDFSPNQLKNYPVQGFATGDVVPTMLGYLYKQWLLLDQDTKFKVKIVNTVHDSVILDAHPREVNWTCAWVATALGRTNQVIKERYGITLPTKLSVDVEYGHSWSTMKKWEK